MSEFIEYPKEFRIMRKAVLLEAKNRCSKCSDIATDVHHIDKNVNNNSFQNLKAICQKCHLKIHGKYPQPKRKPKVKQTKETLECIALIRSRGLKQKDIASLLDVNKYLISNWLNGKNNISPVYQRLIKKCLKK